MSDRPTSDLVFTGSIPDLYETFMVPLIFQPYADDIAVRVAGLHPSSVLEVAAGTGVVTRALSATLPHTAAITATDLNQPMIDYAAGVGTDKPVVWRQADAMNLPFEDSSFDVVVCQFGAMFFPDRVQAYGEFGRVLRRRGSLIFNVWDSIEHNEFADAVTDAVATLFPDNPPRFLARTPHGHSDTAVIVAELASAGFSTPPRIDTVEARSRAASCTSPAIGYCQGTPLRNEIEARDASRLEEATGIAAAFVADRFGETDIDGKIRAFVITAVKP